MNGKIFGIIVTSLLISSISFAGPSAVNAEGAKSKKGKAMEIKPGQSIGEVSIGEKKESLLKKGFKTDDATSSTYQKGQLSARLENDQVVQIWFDAKDWTTLKIHGKKFPAKKDLATMQKFLKNCESVIQGSGGELMYCENRGLEISSSFQDKSDFGLSVVTPELVEKITGTRK